MRELTPDEAVIYNDGERLIPGVTHNVEEVIRHRSSYLFFRRIIESDLALQSDPPRPVRIVDLGSGVGHGCCILADIRGAEVLGVDASLESLDYARAHYARRNIEYRQANLVEFMPRMPEYDYVVSRGVLEHVPDGVNLARETKWRHQLLFDVPYAEPPGENPHHLLSGIREDDFERFPGAELFFQDLAGVIYDRPGKPPNPNMIICVCSRSDRSPVNARAVAFPVPAWRPSPFARVRELTWRGLGSRVRRWLATG